MLKCAEHLPLLCFCNICNYIWISREFIYCPVCDCANYHIIPIYEHVRFTLSWLIDNNFMGGDEKKMLREDEIRNLKLMMMERMSVMPDQHEKERTRVFISALECVLND